MVDYAYRSQVIKSGLPRTAKLVSQAKWCSYLNSTRGTDYKSKIDLSTALELERHFCSNDDWIEANKIVNADYHRREILAKRILEILACGDSLFLTLTFTDETLANTSPETRRRYVTRFLKEQCDLYVANIDFGKNKGREHYHAVVASGHIDLTPWHKLGAIKAQHIRDNSNPKKLASYVAKLTNHAIKETCKRSAIIYSR